MDKDIQAELETVKLMLGIYCRDKHGARKLCPACSELLSYASARLAKCPHHPKPSCRNCATHCYNPENRARIAEVMRYSGPRMLLRHPLYTLKHYLKK
ncbi:MAG: hypothetical protein COX65_00035 [Elusimicrobia bacterium CG_4_10_14_0_2_um_filter_56_8]|nr:MAG: hypothetical protein AUJ51_13485 [Elusimicrobia bacterium CG1_02_56_21]PJA18078.1 MAG: hypothetical protein COX65_00035 [Elusimicrobia bacterium CG_4_10_14_0_2_um_filter_56_8]